ncbi:acyl-CoA dehydrogenase family protein [Ilumatobacter sp.]|uniref:acyl-CoA dehydrogenase family protein n=1 Tax=Ilumatobacter sp. TaxID=1967498 RepID=UPI003B51C439
MDFEISASTQKFLDELDEFIESTIVPMQSEDDNDRFFDHRREDSRTDWDRDGLPNAEWEALLGKMRRAADDAGFYRHQLPERFGGKGGTNLEMAIVREHLARKGLGLHNDLQNESSIVGNLVTVLMMEKYGSDAQQEEWIPKMLAGEARIGFGLTEPLHGSDATWMETTAVRDGDEWIISGEKYWNTGLHHATHDYIFARTSGEPGDGRGITCFITPTDSPGFSVEEFMWTFNMPTDHAHVKLDEVRVGHDTILGEEGMGLQTAQLFVHENRIRQAASSLGAGLHCIDRAVEWANDRVTFGKRLSTNQAIQFPLAELYTEAEMLRALIHKTAWQLDEGYDHMEITDKVAMCNYRGNRFCCDAADRAMQTCGGEGYNRAMPFEHIYRHHRRYRITEGSEEIQIRKVAGKLFGFAGRAKG